MLWLLSRWQVRCVPLECPLESNLGRTPSRVTKCRTRVTSEAKSKPSRRWSRNVNRVGQDRNVNRSTVQKDLLHGVVGRLQGL
jgi:hypothetical protein